MRVPTGASQQYGNFFVLSRNRSGAYFCDDKHTIFSVLCCGITEVDVKLHTRETALECLELVLQNVLCCCGRFAVFFHQRVV